MKILVTGANGLLGSHVAAELIKRNYKVRVLVRPGSNLSALEGLPVEYFMGQLTLKEDVEKAVSGCTGVIHSAALAVHKPTHLKAFYLINVESTRYIAEACIKMGNIRLVHVSTANCYRNGSISNPGTEANPFPVWMKKSGYAYSKYLAEQLVLDLVRENGLDAVVVSPAFIVGKDAKPGGGRIFNYILGRKIAFHPPGGKNFVDAGAAAAGVANALEKGRKGEAYLLAGENMTYSQFFRLVKTVTGQRTLLVPVPCLFLRLAGLAGDLSEKLLNKPLALTSVNARMLCLGNYYTPQKAIKEIDFHVVPVKEAIEKALQGKTGIAWKQV